MRYLALHWSSVPPHPFVSEMIDQARSVLRLSRLLEGRSWVLLGRTEDLSAIVAPEPGGVFGDLFDRSQPPRRVQAAAPIGTADADHLSRCYWGRYIAFLQTLDGHLDVFRDPSGGLPCFYARRHGVDLVFDTLEAPGRLGWLSGEIQWDYIAEHVAFGGLRGARTGIAGVREILPGQALRLGRDVQTARLVWSPRAFCAQHRQITDPTEAAQNLRREVENSVQALASAQGNIVLELSGGLDSSIVAMCLRGRPGTFAVNCTTAGGEGDERAYAREVAKSAGLPLVEQFLLPGDIDFQAPPAAWLARPGRSTVLQPVDRLFAAEGQARNASAFFNGTGGDGIFCYTQSAGPVVDRLLSQGLSAALLDTLENVATLTGANLWTVASRALRILRRRQRSPTAGGDISHLAAAFKSVAQELHPWLEDRGILLPGRRRHLDNIVAVQGHIDGFDRNSIAPVVAPHGAQPVLELVLSIPTWLWIEGGRDRAVARTAFSDLLPPSVLNRRSKGRINHFIAEAFQDNRRVIADLLIGGLLHQNGLLDPGAVRRTLERPVGYKDEAFLHVIRLVDAELWARSWQEACEVRDARP